MASRSASAHVLEFNRIRDKFYELDQKGCIQAEYVWIGGSGHDLRSKTKTIDHPVNSVADLPEWNFDGSSTGQAPGHDSEVWLKPQALFRDPFRRGNNVIVLCDCYKPDGTPVPSNTRFHAAQIMEKAKEHEPWFGIEQEYVLYGRDGRPLYWPSGEGNYPAPQGPYYCGVGADKAYGRPIVEAHYRACLYAGVKIYGINAEVMPSQWEFQVGTLEGIAIGDHLWMARYLLHRVAEEFDVVVSFDPKPVKGDWNGSGAHTNFSTKAMRAPGGMKHILEAIEKLGKRHKEHIEVYGDGNERRLTGKHETQSIHKFSYGVADRGSSIRIPSVAQKEGCGYFEDRRPAANSDPYLVASKIVETVILN